MNDNIAESKEATLHPILKGISFCFGLVGIILYVIHYDTAPAKSKSAIRYTLLGAFTFLVILIVLLLISGQSDLFDQ